MTQRIPSHQYLINSLVAAVITAILAIPLAWWIPNAFTLAVKGLHYNTYSFMPHEMIFVSEQESGKTVGGDFVLHPNLFQKVGDVYSAEINQHNIQIIVTRRNNPCEATVDTRLIGCEDIVYYGGDPIPQFFIRLTGDVGISADQATQLNQPHLQFENQLETWSKRLLPLVAIIITMGLFSAIQFIGRRYVKWRIPQFSPTIGQKLGLQLPWMAGLAFWMFIGMTFKVW